MANACRLAVPANGPVLGHLFLEKTNNPGIHKWGYQGSPFGNIAGYAVQSLQAPYIVTMCDQNARVIGSLLNFYLPIIQPNMQGWLNTVQFGQVLVRVEQIALSDSLGEISLDDDSNPELIAQSQRAVAEYNGGD